MAPNTTKLGPGTLKLGDDTTGLTLDCQLINGVVSWDNDTSDDITVLCGDKVPGSRTYTSTFAGTFLQDLTDEAGITGFSWTHKGEQVPFEYVPNTAAAVTCTGTVIIDPIDFGSTDDYGTPMQSDFEWDLVGDPVLAFGTGTGGAGAAAAPAEQEPAAAGDTAPADASPAA